MLFILRSRAAEYTGNGSQVTPNAVPADQKSGIREAKDDVKDTNLEKLSDEDNCNKSDKDEENIRRVNCTIGGPLLQVFPPDKKTAENTYRNSLIYNTSHDSIDLYRQENDSSDLIGRLYYDDYGSDGVDSPQSLSPLISPSGSILPCQDHFSLNFSNSLHTDPTSSRTSNEELTEDLSRLGMSLLHHREPSRACNSLERGISFDTLTNSHKKSYTLKMKHPQYRFRRNNKTFLVGYNNDEESLRALEWLFEELIVNGDTVVVLNALDNKLYHEIDKEGAQRSSERIQKLNKKAKKISIVFEIAIGKPRKLLEDAIEEYIPCMMIIGTHSAGEKTSSNNSHRSFLTRPSISRHFLECAVVPVIVVKRTYEISEHYVSAMESRNFFASLLESMVIEDNSTKERTGLMSRLHRTRSTISLRHPSSTGLKQMKHTQKIESKLNKEEQRGRENIPLQNVTRQVSRERSTDASSRPASRVRGFSKLIGSHF